VQGNCPQTQLSFERWLKWLVLERTSCALLSLTLIIYLAVLSCRQTVPGLGFMSRTRVVHSRKLDPTPSSNAFEAEPESPYDAAVANVINVHESLTCHQYVVYSATFQVPAFYFTIHDSSEFWIILRPNYSKISFQMGVLYR
jgi:hypothetical protein